MRAGNGGERAAAAAARGSCGAREHPETGARGDEVVHDVGGEAVARRQRVLPGRAERRGGAARQARAQHAVAVAAHPQRVAVSVQVGRPTRHRAACARAGGVEPVEDVHARAVGCRRAAAVQPGQGARLAHLRQHAPERVARHPSDAVLGYGVDAAVRAEAHASHGAQAPSGVDAQVIAHALQYAAPIRPGPHGALVVARQRRHVRACGERAGPRGVRA